MDSVECGELPLLRLAQRSAVRVVLSAFFVAYLTACTPDVRDRPPGFIRLAPVWALVRPETIIERSAVMVRYDEQGFSVMSTLSTYDLSRLQRVRVGESWHWASKTDGSEFAADGTVLKGPAVAALPYYEMIVDYGGVDSTQPETLYAKLGSQKPPTYRLKPPEHLLISPDAATPPP